MLISIETLDTSGMQYNTDNLLLTIHNTKEVAEKKYNCKIRSFVTDSAANINKIREELAEARCSAHSLNLLAQNFDKLNKNSVVREPWYETAGGKAIVVLIDVRWNYTCNAFLCYPHQLGNICKQMRGP